MSGKSDSVAALNVSVVGYSSWILSKTKQSDFLMQLSLMELLMVLVWKWLSSNQGAILEEDPIADWTTNTGELYLWVDGLDPN